jgi:hypothetical protein
LEEEHPYVFLQDFPECLVAQLAAWRSAIRQQPINKMMPAAECPGHS